MCILQLNLIQLSRVPFGIVTRKVTTMPCEKIFIWMNCCSQTQKMDGGKKGWQDFLIHRYSCQNNKLILKYLFKLFVCVFLNEVLFIFFNFIKDKKKMDSFYSFASQITQSTILCTWLYIILLREEVTPGGAIGDPHTFGRNTI